MNFRIFFLLLPLLESFLFDPKFHTQKVNRPGSGSTSWSPYQIRNGFNMSISLSLEGNSGSDHPVDPVSNMSRSRRFPVFDRVRQHHRNLYSLGNSAKNKQGCQMVYFRYHLMLFPLTTFPLKSNNDFSPNNFSPNVTFPLTTFSPRVGSTNLTEPNLTRVTTMFGYYLTPAAGCQDQGYQVGVQ
jgi:hypothetical protein